MADVILDRRVQLRQSYPIPVGLKNRIVAMTVRPAHRPNDLTGQPPFAAMTQDHADNEAIKTKINETAKKFFKPEFLNRLDDLIVFKMLDKEQLSVIVNLEVEKVVARLKKRNINISLDTTATEFLMKEGYDPQYGARPMRRAVEKNIEDPLSEHLLRGDVREGDVVKVTFDPETKRLKFAAEAAPKPEVAEEAATSTTA